MLTGRAKLAQDAPPPDEHAAYLAKYAAAMARVSGEPHQFSAAYPVAVQVEVTRVRGF